MSTTVDEIAIKLGIQTGDLKAALADANAQVKTFGEQGAHHASGFTAAIHETSSAMKLFHHFMVAGGILEAVKSFYEMAIGYAEKHKENTDEQTKAVRRFGEAIKDSGGFIASVSVQVLGFFNQAGEGMADFYNMIVHGREEAQKAYEINVAAEEDLKEIAKARTETLKEIADLQQKNAEAAEKNKWADFEALDLKTKEDILVKAITEGLAHAATREEDSLEFQKTKMNILEYQGRLIKLGEEDAKLQTAELKKQTEELTKQAIAQEKYAESVDEQYAKLRMEALPAEQQLTMLMEHQAELQNDLTKHKEGSLVYEQDYIELAKTEKDIAELNLKIAKDTTQEIKNQVAAKAMVVDVNGAPDYASMSSAMLQGIIQKQNDLLNSVTDFNLGGGGGVQVRNASQSDYGNWLAAQMANKQLAGAQAELNQRSRIQSYAAQFGQDAAIGQFGDNAVSRALAAQNTTAQNTLTALTAVAQTLNKVFPNQATTVTATH